MSARRIPRLLKTDAHLVRGADFAVSRIAACFGVAALALLHVP